ncbi:Zinc carboxypeptidase [Serratia liquefaciens]|uniref:M14 family metallopeptidase n=1 Tax=Serratia liquefaciens TaxID=614 RepID=UPI0021832690|nr:M14 family metallocarboxypeptidase [Serratia liquefaciens]CAI2538215.1 Zinc carboxypeptidase [Serratia liquefaciens]
MSEFSRQQHHSREIGQHIWPVHSDNTQSNDITVFRRAFKQQAKRWGLLEVVLGTLPEGNISLYQSANQEARVPHVVIAAGFHGEEPAGSWGLLDFLRKGSPTLLDKIAISFLPVVNLSGWALGQRLNNRGQNPNRGFCTGMEDIPSEEGRCILRHSRLLQKSASQGILACHEDILQDRAYLYSFERSSIPGPFSTALADELKLTFPLVRDEKIDGCECQQGLIFNHIDSSFESWLFELGADVAACTETPGRASFDERIKTNHQVIRAFISAVLEKNNIGTGMS